MRKRLLPGFYAAWAAALLIHPDAALSAPVDPLTQITCKMSVPAKVRAGSPVQLTFELGNKSKKAIYALNWNTPLEGFFGRYLTVTGPQGEVEYGGAVVKRALPTREEYVILPPGGKVSKSADLAKAYELKTPGKYRIEFVGRISDATSGKIPRSFEQQTAADIDCAPVTLEITAR
jgi:hypothetical protein